MGEHEGSSGGDRFDYYIDDIDLSGFHDLPALLFVTTMGVNWWGNFITFNAPPEVSGVGWEHAKDKPYFAGTLFTSADGGNDRNMQIIRVPSGVLRASNNRLGIHSRNVSGHVSGDRDSFLVTQIILVYFGSE
jgi:hypothetical protein